MTRRKPKSKPARQCRVRLERAMRTTGSAALVLVLFLSPALVWPQTAVPDMQSGPAHEQRTQQSGSTGDSATQPDAATQSKPETPATAPVQDPTPVGQKEDNSEGKQTKRMFGVVPNFAAVSANTELPPLTVRGKFVLAKQERGLFVVHLGGNAGWPKHGFEVVSGVAQRARL